jgi:hypothetical protein
VQQKRGDAGRLGPQDFNNPTARQASDSDDTIEFSQPDWDDLDVRGCRGTQPLDRTVAKLFLDTGDRCGDVTVAPDLINSSGTSRSHAGHHRTEVL